VYWTGGCDELTELEVDVELLEPEKLELDEFELLEEVFVGVELAELEAMLEDKEGFGPTSPHAVKTNNVSKAKNCLLVFRLNIMFLPLDKIQ
jgi:hypothetical protein